MTQGGRLQWLNEVPLMGHHLVVSFTAAAFPPSLRFPSVRVVRRSRATPPPRPSGSLDLTKNPQPLGFINQPGERFRVLARLCDDPGGGVVVLRRTTGEEAKRRQVPEDLVRFSQSTFASSTRVGLIAPSATKASMPSRSISIWGPWPIWAQTTARQPVRASAMALRIWARSGWSASYEQYRSTFFSSTSRASPPSTS